MIAGVSIMTFDEPGFVFVLESRDSHGTAFKLVVVVVVVLAADLTDWTAYITTNGVGMLGIESGHCCVENLKIYLSILRGWEGKRVERENKHRQKQVRERKTELVNYYYSIFLGGVAVAEIRIQTQVFDVLGFSLIKPRDRRRQIHGRLFPSVTWALLTKPTSLVHFLSLSLSLSLSPSLIPSTPINSNYATLHFMHTYKQCRR
ncbi:hypothetical protein VNO77_01985 [Canavalia gladiata]|uniref:Uncharacterized protein n=1 Tax=Canavalia gladiata TaxID=3824 RepID=A0AAN9MX16_CANGL